MRHTTYFKENDRPTKHCRAMQRLGIDDPLSVLESLKMYTTSASRRIREADLKPAKAMAEHILMAANLNEFISCVPGYQGTLYHGCRVADAWRYGLLDTAEGSTFSFPCITSLSSSLKAANNYNEGCLITILNSTQAPSIQAFSVFSSEEECLTNKTISYEVIQITDINGTFEIILKELNK